MLFHHELDAAWPLNRGLLYRVKLAFGLCAEVVMMVTFEPTAHAILTPPLKPHLYWFINICYRTDIIIIQCCHFLALCETYWQLFCDLTLIWFLGCGGGNCYILISTSGAGHINILTTYRCFIYFIIYWQLVFHTATRQRAQRPSRRNRLV